MVARGRGPHRHGRFGEVLELLGGARSVRGRALADLVADDERIAGEPAARDRLRDDLVERAADGVGERRVGIGDLLEAHAPVGQRLEALDECGIAVLEADQPVVDGLEEVRVGGCGGGRRGKEKARRENAEPYGHGRSFSGGIAHHNGTHRGVCVSG